MPSLVSAVIIVSVAHFILAKEDNRAIPVLMPSKLSTSQVYYLCPDSTIQYEFKACDPPNPIQCAHGQACRLSKLIDTNHTDQNSSDRYVYQCCDASHMTLQDWFEALQLSPQIIPKVPTSSIDNIHLNNFNYNTQSPVVHMNDDISALNYPNYVIANIQSFQLSTKLTNHQATFLHLLLLIDANMNRSTAIFLNYNINYDDEIEQSSAVNISNSYTKQEQFFGAISHKPIPEQATYRHQYTALLFSTKQPITTNITSDILTYLPHLSTFLSRSPTGVQLGDPIAGTFFYVRSCAINRPFYCYVKLSTTQSRSSIRPIDPTTDRRPVESIRLPIADLNAMM
ncbi:unnamed protein product [Anisakis simplex]|uniref:Uncharacterized protein n=1 Tax=Anisakis simplex TaxID=6269 RepID=A0A0M3JXV8_ANISI|nr:unnamed protein product [Anisakis simplex]